MIKNKNKNKVERKKYSPKAVNLLKSDEIEKKKKRSQIQSKIIGVSKSGNPSATTVSTCSVSSGVCGISTSGTSISNEAQGCFGGQIIRLKIVNKQKTVGLVDPRTHLPNMVHLLSILRYLNGGEYGDGSVRVLGALVPHVERQICRHN